MAEASSPAAAAAQVHIDAKLEQLGYKLPAPTKSVANYIMCNRVGNIIYTGKWLLSCISNTYVKSDDSLRCAECVH